MRGFELKSVQFRRERQGSWLELEKLLGRIDRRGVGSLSAEELSRLPILYRTSLSSLSVARAISLDRNLIEYLEGLSGRAYFAVYGTKRHLREIIAEFIGRRFPAAVRRHIGSMALAALILGISTLTGFLLTLRDSERFYSFVGAEYAQGRTPAASTGELRATLFDEGTGWVDTLIHFAAFLFTHNAKIGMLCFALGFAAGVPVFYLLFTNGLILGAFAALFHSRGLSVEFWSWILPHGVTELLALILCGGAGLILGRGLVFPGLNSRMENLARLGREAGVIVIGAVMMFAVAGLIEGLFRQLVQDLAVRYSVVVASLLLWSLYFALAGRRRLS